MIEFRAYGIPRPQGSKRAFVNKYTGKPVIVEANSETHRAWRAVVAHEAAAAMNGEPLLRGPLTVQMTFAMPRPKSHRRDEVTWPTSPPDADKLARLVSDSCTGTVWVDDAQVVYWVLRKLWAEVDVPHGPGVHVAVAEVSPPDLSPAR